MSTVKQALLTGVAASLLLALAGCPAAFGPSYGWGYELFTENAGHQITQRADGGYFVGGTAWLGSEAGQEFVVFLDATGNVERQQIFPGLYSQSAQGPSSTPLIARDGAVYMAGLTAADAGPDRYHGRLRVVKTDAVGNTLWDNTYGDDHWVPESIVELSDGGIVIAGQEIPATNSQTMALKLDADGSLLWTRFFDAYGVAMDVRGLLETPSGDILLAGRDVTGDSEAAVLRLSSAGDFLSFTVHSRALAQRVRTVAQAVAGGCYLAGTTRLANGKDRPYLLKTDANGEFEWDKEDIYVPAEAGADVEVWDMVVDDEGYIAMVGDEETVEYVPGIPFPIIGNTSFVMRLDPAGNLQWKKDLGAFTYGIDYTQQGTYITTGFEFTSQHHYLRVVEVDKTGKVVN